MDARVARNLSWSLDPARMFHDATGHDADDWQRQFLLTPSKRVLTLVGRQLGKSWAAAVRAVHQASYQAGSLTLMVSIGERQALLLFDKAVSVQDRLEPVPTTKRLQTECNWPTAPRFWAPGDPATIRGYTPDLVILDESSRADEGLLAACCPCWSIPAGH